MQPTTGASGINGFLHAHGPLYPWPLEAWRLPESDPGAQVWRQIELPPGGNRVRSYLDVVCPDDTPAAMVDEALTSLWLELIAEEAGPTAAQGAFPNPVVYGHGQVVVRFGVELGMMPNRALELAELRAVVDVAAAVLSKGDTIAVYQVKHGGRTITVLPEVFREWTRSPSKVLRSMSEPGFIVPRGTPGKLTQVLPFADHEWGSAPG